MSSRPFVLLVGLFALALGWPANALAADVVVFDDPAYVDTVGGAFSESDTIQASLAAQGHTVTAFTGTSAAAWTAALAGKNALVIPEQESGSLGSALPAATILVIQGFVSAGGGVVVSDDYRGTLNAIFGFSLVGGGGSTSTLTGAAAGTQFATGPASIPGNNATASFTTASLPPGSTSVYAFGANTVVALMPFGSGKIVHLGWDWFNAQPLGSQDGGWLAVLGSAVTEVGTTPAPTVTCTTSVSALQPWGAASSMSGSRSPAAIRRRRSRSRSTATTRT